MGWYTQVIYNAMSFNKGFEQSRILVSTPRGSWNLSPVETKGKGTTLLVEWLLHIEAETCHSINSGNLCSCFSHSLSYCELLWLNRHILNYFYYMMDNSVNISNDKTYSIVILRGELNFRVFSSQSLKLFRISFHLQRNTISVHIKLHFLLTFSLTTSPVSFSAALECPFTGLLHSTRGSCRKVFKTLKWKQILW